MEPTSQRASDRFRRLLEPVHARAAVFARSIARSTDDGDDLLQEALVRALAKLDSLRDDGAFRYWLYRIIITVHRNRYKRAFWRRLLPLEHEPEGETRTEDDVGSAARARRALAELPHDQRETIVLFEIEGWKVEEIAALEGVSVSAIKSRLARGRERLRTIYTQRFGVLAPRLVPGGPT